MLASGFTSAISFGSTYKIDVALRDAIRAGQLPGPRLLAAGRDLGATASNVDSGGGLSQIADGPWALRKAVREQRKLRVDVVKIFIDGEAINPISPPGEPFVLRRRGARDRRRGAPPQPARGLPRALGRRGQTGRARGRRLRGPCELPGRREAVDLLAEHKDRIFVGPAIAWEVQYVNQCESLGLSKAAVRAQGYEAEIEATVESVARLRAAGVRLVVGGDYGISIAPHGTYAKDLEYFVDLFGLSPAEALLCATRNGGQAMDPRGRLGTLAAGSLADFVVVDGDPLADVRVLQDHDRLTVVKGGTPLAESAKP